MNFRRMLASFIALCASFPLPALAGYPANPAVNMPVTTSPTGQDWKTMIADGAGCTIVAWEDASAGNLDIYAQKLDLHGNRLWSPPNGVPISTWAQAQRRPLLTPDGLGGATLLWTDERNGDLNPDIYFDIISSTGYLFSGGYGFVVCDNPAAQYLEDAMPKLAIQLMPVGTFSLWNDERDDAGDLYLQLSDGAGDPSYDPAGVPVCVAQGVQAFARMAEIGSAGMVIAWRDYRPGSGVADGAIYAQRFNGTAMTWTMDGIIVAPTMGTSQQHVSVVSNLDNYAIVVWMGFDNSFLPAVYAQRLDQNGAAQWGAGVRVSPVGSASAWPVATADGAGGVYIAWIDDGLTHIRAQRINGAGNLLWGASGVSVLNSANVTGGLGDSHQYWTDLVRTSMGVMLSWSDDRDGVFNTHVFAQHLSSVNGDLWSNWPDQGLLVCSQASFAPRMVTDESSGAVVAWQDRRAGEPDADIYAQGINPDGTLGDGVTAVGDSPRLGTRTLNSPNPFSSSTVINFTLPADGAVTLEVFDIRGRRVFQDHLSASQARTAYRFGGLNTSGTPLPSGTYFYKVKNRRAAATGRFTIVR